MTVDINELRKVIADCYWPTSPVTINELLDRLEAAEKERDAAELMSLALRAKVEALKQECSAMGAMIQVAIDVLGEVRGNINPERGYADELEADVERAIDTIAQPAPSVPDGWLRAIDEALVAAHIGVANAHDTYEQAKAKLDNLIGFNVDIAIDPAVNGGYKLVPIEPTKEMIQKACSDHGYPHGDSDVYARGYRSMLAASPEAKP